MNHAAASISPYAELYGHGGRLGAAARLFPQARTPWIDLSTGISPWPYPAEAETDWSRLPEPAALTGLEAAAAACFGAPDPEEVVAVPGSDLALRLLPQLLGVADARYLSPIYSGHKAAWPDASPMVPGTLGRAELLILCNPNNPDGRTTDRSELYRFPGQIIVDEAFADTMPGLTLAPDRRGAIVLRSFGKFFGLPGLRLGFVIADRPLARRLRALIGDWPVGSATIAIATAAYRDSDWQASQRQRLADASQRLDTLLKACGLTIAGGTPLFRLARCERGSELFHHLAQAGILTRPFADDANALRFGLPGEAPQWQRLEQALSAWSNQ